MPALIVDNISWLHKKDFQDVLRGLVRNAAIALTKRISQGKHTPFLGTACETSSDMAILECVTAMPTIHVT